jgi:hypothetical protein
MTLQLAEDLAEAKLVLGSECYCSEVLGGVHSSATTLSLELGLPIQWLLPTAINKDSDIVIVSHRYLLGRPRLPLY